MLPKLFPNHTYVTKDVPSIAESAEKGPKTFFAQFLPPQLIDEIQHAPGLFRFLKQRVDESRHAMGQFILSGSQKFSLMHEKKIPDFADTCGFVVCRTPHQFPLGKLDVHVILLEHLRENNEKPLV